tara:strand:- start:220 stop:849 length:630 start_codon:yes stop_codon:yes gene_type:complete
MTKSSNYFYYINAGEEKSVAATKTFVMTLLILLKLVLPYSIKKISSIIEELSIRLLNDTENQWNPKSIDSKVSTGFILGRGVGYALTNEISLKFKELCQEQIEPFSSAEVMHGPRSLVQNSFKLFTLSINDKSGVAVKKDSQELIEYTNFFYDISFKESSILNYKPFKYTEFDPIIIMTKFYPWIINYTFIKGLDPDKPRYLTKITQTY